MKNHLFPVKLHEIIRRLIESKAFLKRTPPPELTNTPDDGKARYMLYSSGVHESFPEFDGYRRQDLRKRIAIPADYLFMGIRHVTFEVYSRDGVLLYSKPVVETEGYLSATIEAELLTLLLEVQGVKIATM